MYDNSWVAQPNGPTDPTATASLPLSQEQSLFDVLMGSHWMTSDTWSDRTFNVDDYGGFVPGWDNSMTLP